MYVNNRHWGISIKFHFLLKYIWLGDKKKKILKGIYIPSLKKIEEASKSFLAYKF